MPDAAVAPGPSLDVATAHGDVLAFPYRIYHGLILPPPADPALARAAACVYSRHNDGGTRQASIAVLLDRPAAHEVPYIVRLLGEYVLPIIEGINRAIAAADGDLAVYRAFAEQNPGFMRLTAARATSYWN